MAIFSKGKYSLMVSDRSGLAYPYREMVREWTGMWVHISEYESKQPQLFPKPKGADPQALEHPRPARTEFYTPTILPSNPFTTSVGATVTVTQDDHGRSTGDAVRFRNIIKPAGDVEASVFMMETTLATDITDSATTLTLTDASNFPTAGYIVIDEANNDNETIEYTGKSGNDLTGLTRGTGAPTYNLAQLATTASAHSAGDSVAGTYSITKVDDDSYTFPLVTSATVVQAGGGFEGFAGPVNTRA